MMTVMKTGRALWLAIAVCVIAVDALSKAWIVRHMALYQRIDLIPNLLSLTLLHNTGAPFSLLYSAGGWQRWLLAAIAVLVSAGLLTWIWRLRPGMEVLGWAISLVLGGAIGNLVDRLRLGYVVDFIHVHYGDWHFPAFNVADSAITVGAVLMLIDMLVLEGRRHV